MDADDVMPARCAKELRRLIRRHPRADVAYQVQVRIPPGPGEFSASVVDHVKLFPNRSDVRFEHRIHEQILPAIRRAGLEVRFSDLYVTHQNYDRSPEGQLKKRRRDFRLLELDLKDRPDHPFVLFNLGMTYLYATKEYEVAAHYLRRSLDRSQWQDSIVRKAYAMLALARLADGEWDVALAANEEGRRYYPDDAELLFQAGQIYAQQRRFDEARQALERLVFGQDDPHYRSVDVGLRTYRGHHELALLFRRLGDPGHAEQVLREIAATYPAYLPAQLDLVETLHARGKSVEARALLSQPPKVSALQEDVERLRSWLNEGVGCRVSGVGTVGDSPRAHVISGFAASRQTLATPPGSAYRRPLASLVVPALHPTPDWEHAPIYGRRRPTLIQALQRLRQICPGPPCIVETGTLRDASPRARDGDGWSTLAWAWYCTQTGGRVVTVDIDPENLEICRQITASHADRIEYVASDSVRFLREWRRDERGEIHFLYLDSLDYFPHQQAESEEHHRAEAEAALPALAPRCLVLLDDTHPDGGPRFTGKGARAIPFLLEHGFQIEWAQGDQVRLSRE